MASKSGILETKGGNVKHKKDLWVVVKDGTLYIYKEENQTSDPIDWFSLLGADVRSVDTKDSKTSRDFCFVVSSPKKLFKDHKFYPKSEGEMNAWMQVISSTPLSRSATKGGSMTNLFGVDLEVSCFKSKSTIPSVITQCIDYLQKHTDVQGIFRISASSTDVDSLKSSFDSGSENLQAISDPNIVANVMKLYLRELPNPLIPYEMYDKFVFVSKESKDNQLTHTSELFRELPKNNQDTLAYLFSFLKKVSERDSINKMTAQNLAVVFAPSILKPREETMTTIGNSEIINSLVEKWILNYDVVFKGIGSRSISPSVATPPPVTPSQADAPPKRVAPSPLKRSDPGQPKPGSFSTLPNMDELNAKLKTPVPSVNVTSPGQPRPPPLKRSVPGPSTGAAVSANPLPIGPGQLKRSIVSDPAFKSGLPSQSLDSMIKKEPETNLKATKSTDRAPGNRLSAGNLPTGVNIPPPVAPMVTLPPPINLPPPIVQQQPSNENKLAPPRLNKSPSMEEGLSALLAKQPSLEDKMKDLEDLQKKNAELVKRIQKHVAGTQ